MNQFVRWTNMRYISCWRISSSEEDREPSWSGHWGWGYEHSSHWSKNNIWRSAGWRL